MTTDPTPIDDGDPDGGLWEPLPWEDIAFRLFMAAVIVWGIWRLL